MKLHVPKLSKYNSNNPFNVNKQESVQNNTDGEESLRINLNMISALRFLNKEFINWTKRRNEVLNTKVKTYFDMTVDGLPTSSTADYKVEVDKELEVANNVLIKLEQLFNTYRDNPSKLLESSLNKISKDLETLKAPAEILLGENPTPTDIFIALNYIYYQAIPEQYKKLIQENADIYTNMVDTMKRHSLNEDNEYRGIYESMPVNGFISVQRGNFRINDIPMYNNIFINSMHFLNKRHLYYRTPYHVNSSEYALMSKLGRKLFNKLPIPTHIAPSNGSSKNIRHLYEDIDNIDISLKACSFTNKWTSGDIQPVEEAKYITGNVFNYPAKLVAGASLFIESLEDIIYHTLSGNVNVMGKEFISTESPSSAMSLLSRFSVLNTPISIYGESYVVNGNLSEVCSASTLNIVNEYLYTSETYNALNYKTSHKAILAPEDNLFNDYNSISSGFVLPSYARERFTGITNILEQETTFYTEDKSTPITDKFKYPAYVDPYRSNERLYIDLEYGLTSAVALFDVAVHMYGIANTLKFIGKLVGTMKLLINQLKTNNKFLNYNLLKCIAPIDTEINALIEDYVVASKSCEKRGVALEKNFLRNTLQEALFIYYHTLLTFLGEFRAVKHTVRYNINKQMFVKSNVDIIAVPNKERNKQQALRLSNNMDSIYSRISEDGALYNVVWTSYLSKFNKPDNKAMDIIPYTQLGAVVENKNGLFNRQQKVSMLVSNNIHFNTSSAAIVPVLNTYNFYFNLHGPVSTTYAVLPRNYLNLNMFNQLNYSVGDTYINMYLATEHALSGESSFNKPISTEEPLFSLYGRALWSDILKGENQAHKFFKHNPVSTHPNINIINPPNAVGTSVNKQVLDYKLINPIYTLANTTVVRGDRFIGAEAKIYTLEEELNASLHEKIPTLPDVFTNTYNLPFMLKNLSMGGLNLYNYIMGYKYINPKYFKFPAILGVMYFGISDSSAYNIYTASDSLFNKRFTPTILSTPQTLHDTLGSTEIYNIVNHPDELLRSFSLLHGNTAYSENLYYTSSEAALLKPSTYKSLNSYHRALRKFSQYSINTPLAMLDDFYVIEDSSFVFSNYLNNEVNSLFDNPYLIRGNTARVGSFNNTSDIIGPSYFDRVATRGFIQRNRSLVKDSLNIMYLNGTYRLNSRDVARVTSRYYNSNNTLFNIYMNMWLGSIYANPLAADYMSSHTNALYNNDVTQFKALVPANYDVSPFILAYKTNTNSDHSREYIKRMAGMPLQYKGVSIFDTPDEARNYYNNYSIGSYNPHVVMQCLNIQDKSLNGVEPTSTKAVNNTIQNTNNFSNGNGYSFISSMLKTVANKDLAKLTESLNKYLKETTDLLTTVNKSILNITRVCGLDVHPVYSPKMDKQVVHSDVKNEFSSYILVSGLNEFSTSDTFKLTQVCSRLVDSEITIKPIVHKEPLYLTNIKNKPYIINTPMFIDGANYISDFGVNMNFKEIYNSTLNYSYIDFFKSDLDKEVVFLNDRYSTFDNTINTKRMSKGVSVNSMEYVQLLHKLMGVECELDTIMEQHISSDKGLREGLFVAAANTYKEAAKRTHTVSSKVRYLKDRGLLNNTNSEVLDVVPSLVVKESLGIDVGMLQNPETTTIGIDTSTFKRAEEITKLTKVDVYYSRLLELRDVVLARLQDSYATLSEQEEPITVKVETFINDFKSNAYKENISVLALTAQLLSAELLISVLNNRENFAQNTELLEELNITPELVNNYFKAAWVDLEAVPRHSDIILGSLHKGVSQFFNGSAFPRIYEMQQLGNDIVGTNDIINTRFETLNYDVIGNELNNIRLHLTALYETLRDNKFSLRTYLIHIIEIYVSVMKLGGYSKGSEHIDVNAASSDIATNIIITAKDSVSAIEDLPNKAAGLTTTVGDNVILHSLYKHFALLNLYGIYNLQDVFITTLNNTFVNSTYYRDNKINIVKDEGMNDAYNTLAKSITKGECAPIANGDILGLFIKLVSKYLVIRKESEDSFAEVRFIPTDDCLSIHRYLTLVDDDGKKATAEQIVDSIIQQFRTVEYVDYKHNITAEEASNCETVSCYGDPTFIASFHDVNDGEPFAMHGATEFSISETRASLRSREDTNLFDNIIDTLDNNLCKNPSMKSVYTTLDDLFTSPELQIVLSDSIKKVIEGYGNRSVAMSEFIGNDILLRYKGVSISNSLDNSLSTSTYKWFRAGYNYNKSIVSNIIRNTAIRALYETHNINEDIAETLHVTNSWLKILIANNLLSNHENIIIKDAYESPITNESTITETALTIGDSKSKFLVSLIANDGDAVIRLLYTYMLLQRHLVVINNVNWVLNSAIQGGDNYNNLMKYKALAAAPFNYEPQMDKDLQLEGSKFIEEVSTHNNLLRNASSIWLGLLNDNVGSTSLLSYNSIPTSKILSSNLWLQQNEGLVHERHLEVHTLPDNVKQASIKFRMGLNIYTDHSHINNYLAELGTGVISEDKDTHSLPRNLINKYTDWKITASTISDASFQYKLGFIKTFLDNVVEHKRDTNHLNMLSEEATKNSKKNLEVLRGSVVSTKLSELSNYKKKVELIKRTKYNKNQLVDNFTFNKSSILPDWLVHVNSKDYATCLGKALTPLLYKTMDYIKQDSLHFPLNFLYKVNADIENLTLLGAPYISFSGVRVDTNAPYSINARPKYSEFNYETALANNRRRLFNFNAGNEVVTAQNRGSCTINIEDNSLVNEIGDVKGIFLSELGINPLETNSFNNKSYWPLVQSLPDVLIDTEQVFRPLVALPDNINGNYDTITRAFDATYLNNPYRLKINRKLALEKKKQHIQPILTFIKDNNYKYEQFINEFKNSITHEEFIILESFNWLYNMLIYSYLIYSDIIKDIISISIVDLYNKKFSERTGDTPTTLKQIIRHMLNNTVQSSEIFELVSNIFAGCPFIDAHLSRVGKDVELHFSKPQAMIDNVDNEYVKLALSIVDLGILRNTGRVKVPTVENDFINIMDLFLRGLAVGSENKLALSPYREQELKDMFTAVQSIAINNKDLHSLLSAESLYNYVSYSKNAVAYRGPFGGSHKVRAGITSVAIVPVLEDAIYSEFSALGLPYDNFNLLYIINNITNNVGIGVVWNGIYTNSHALVVSFNSDLVELILNSIDREAFMQAAGIPTTFSVKPLKDFEEDIVLNRFLRNPSELVEVLQIEGINSEYSTYKLAEEFQTEVSKEISNYSSISNLNIDKIIDKYSTICFPLNYFTYKKNDKVVSTRTAPLNNKKYLFDQIKSGDIEVKLQESKTREFNAVLSGVHFLPPLYTEFSWFEMEKIVGAEAPKIGVCNTEQALVTPFCNFYKWNDRYVDVNTYTLLEKLKGYIYPNKPLKYSGVVNLSDLVDSKNLEPRSMCKYDTDAHVFTISKDFTSLSTDFLANFKQKYKIMSHGDNTLHAFKNAVNNFTGLYGAQSKNDTFLTTIIGRNIHNLPLQLGSSLNKEITDIILADGRDSKRIVNNLNIQKWNQDYLSKSSGVLEGLNYMVSNIDTVSVEEVMRDVMSGICKREGLLELLEKYNDLPLNPTMGAVVDTYTYLYIIIYQLIKTPFNYIGKSKVLDDVAETTATSNNIVSLLVSKMQYLYSMKDSVLTDIILESKQKK